MDGSICTDESSPSDTAPISTAGKPPAVETLRRMGSGNSVILDPEAGVEAEAESGRKLPSSRFKGVVPQPNGRWGAQIYEKHQRVWLGTFNEEAEAAHAYDVAALRFRGRDSVTNFKSPPPSFAPGGDAGDEAAFLDSHSKAEIVDMLRKHTYADELLQSKRKRADGGGGGCRVSGAAVPGYYNPADSARAREQLFEKAVTPSDVGKLNRLVIPKQHAEKHFPLPTGTAASKGLLLNFEDVTGKVWRFRYSYWNSSQSYVLTKGWSQFVKEKNLEAGDIVGFHRSTGPGKELFINWKAMNSTGSVANPAQPSVPVQMVRLFGVNIFNIPEVSLGKKMREVDPSECRKKQRIVGAW